MAWRLVCPYDLNGTKKISSGDFMRCADGSYAVWVPDDSWSVTSFNLDLVSMTFGSVLLLWCIGIGVGFVVFTVRKLR